MRKLGAGSRAVPRTAPAVPPSTAPPPLGAASPAAAQDTGRPAERLRTAYTRYQSLVARRATADSPLAAELAAARLDVCLALVDCGDPLPDRVLLQLERDARAVLDEVPPLA